MKEVRWYRDGTPADSPTRAPLGVSSARRFGDALQGSLQRNKDGQVRVAENHGQELASVSLLPPPFDLDVEVTDFEVGAVGPADHIFEFVLLVGG